MCFHGEPPTVFNAKIVTARREHKCCECRVVIGRGEKYERANGIWNGEANTYCTCGRCVEERKRIELIEVAAGCHGGDAVPPFGELWEISREYAG